MPVITTAAVATFIGAVLLEAGKGVLGGQTDAAVTMGWKRLTKRFSEEQRLANHDLERAVARAFLMAQRRCCQECLEQVEWRNKFWQDEIGWLKSRMKRLKVEVDGLDKAKDVTAPVDNLEALTPFLVPESAPPSLDAVKKLLVEEACRGEKPPVEYKAYLNRHLFDRMCSYLGVEVKYNDPAGKALVAEYLAILQLKSVEHDEALERIEACLLEIGEDLTRQLGFLDGKLDLIIAYLLELMDRKATATRDLCVFDVRSQQPNRYFTGRDGLMREIQANFGAGARVQVVAGLGGVGKTQVAIRYCYENRDRYRAVLWMRAGEKSDPERDNRTETAATLGAEYSRLARLLGVANEELEPREAVVQWMAANAGWLLVVDNAEDPEVVEPYLPAGGKGHVLVTSRRQDWTREFQVHRLGVWSSDEAESFLRRRTEESGPELRQLAKVLDRLPLALEQAAAYIQATEIGIRDYLRLLKEEGTLPEPGRRLPGYDAFVQTTWRISFRAVEARSTAAADLLRLCSFFAPDSISQEVIRAGREFLPNALAEAVGREKQWLDTVTLLHNFSLLRREGHELSIHRLVQQVVRDGLSDDAWRACAERALKVVQASLTYDRDVVVTWLPTARLMPHVLAVAEHGEQRSVSPDVITDLLNKAGDYFYLQMQLAPAQAAFKRALVIAEKYYGPEHLEVSSLLNNHGLVLRALGDLAGARTDFERALAIDEKLYGSEHAEVATDLNSLGGVLHALDELVEAKAAFERALAIHEKYVESNQTKVATVLNNLGMVLLDLQDLTGAKNACERALTIDENYHRAEHPQVASDVSSLGLVLHALGELDKARAAFERALDIDEKRFGSEHPTVAIRVNNLGGVLRELKDTAGAKAAYERALAIAEQRFGPEHPTVSSYVGNLARVLFDLEDLSGAQAAYERALEIDLKTYGPEHSTGAFRLLSGLGTVFKASGNPAKARECFRQALTLAEKSFGPEHPTVEKIRSSLEAVQ